MSGKRVKTQLQGFNGPFFPWGVLKLNQMFRSRFISVGADLAMAAEKVPGFIGARGGIETDDSYEWFAGLEFCSTRADRHEKMLILFPWRLMIAERRVLGRSVAVYTTPGFPPEEVVGKLSELKSEIKKLPGRFL
ncbi:hypothetical protein A2716_04850 [candidate division WWE3 bacterium RIFCSPHIGHO2_01_FULL_40_23]|uniref:Uncharacterized protein n=1 Tax=candidate division WWE3 bacterium RIFCSPLOWO2_01_FULL_41_18 TaxID=1802625 RepID=A0A1F4VE00_UNCKA|nr:MAG: hypothetical protein A2716_04850 [candidate division WWE3 bacterium RIFCSPHIGHO2_01_FULL_40_23]OGC55198.1 MAG: hypothetical protein A3A78_04460 [candidate division WWE3 bacterium RIFCSPLOWO2_01_FULL_41_18]